MRNILSLNCNVNRMRVADNSFDSEFPLWEYRFITFQYLEDVE